jgi:recombination protein RecR
MGITHVIRGQDHINNTHKQVLLYQALGKPVPKFAHLPLILGDDGTPLSKRHGAVALSSFKAEGFVPEGLLNYLALLGWGTEGNDEFYSLDDLTKKFSLKRINKAGARFNREKLEWLDGQHIKKLPEAVYLSMMSAFWKERLPAVQAEELKKGKKEVAELVGAMTKVIEEAKSCERCWTFSDVTPCPICRSPKRDQTTLCIVATPQEQAVIERTGEFAGVYHVLRGTIDANDEDTLKHLKLRELLVRLSGVREVILAMNPDVEGETTMLYLTRLIREQHPEIKITRLARGLPMGSDIEYADEITLASALKNRVKN